MKLNRFSIGTRVIIGFTIPMVLLTFVGVWSWYASNMAFQDAKEVKEERLRLALLAQRLGKDMLQVQHYLTELPLHTDQDDEDIYSGAKDFYNAFMKGLDEYEAHYKNANDAKVLADIGKMRKAFSEFYAMGTRMAETFLKEGKEAGNTAKEEFDEAAESMDFYLEPMLRKEREHAERDMDSLVNSMSELRRGVVIVMVVALVLVGLVGMVIILSITRPMKKIGASLEVLAEGDLTEKVDESGQDEISSMGHQINLLTDNLTGSIRLINLQSGSITALVKEILKLRSNLERQAETMEVSVLEVSRQNTSLGDAISRIKHVVKQAADNMDSVSNASGQVADQVHIIAGLAEETSSNVVTMAAAAEEMTANVHGVKSSLEQVNESVDSVAGAVRHMNSTNGDIRKLCGHALEHSSQADKNAEAAREVINALSQSAQRIGQVVAIINRIADQTNMLALNAAIEAAGAGEAGLGFAVVANEVKALARQTGEATQSISQQIIEIQTRTKDAVGAVGEISQVIGRINQSNREIVHAVEEQAAETQAIDSSISRVAQASNQVMQNAAELGHAAQEVALVAAKAAGSSKEIALSSSVAAEAATAMAQQSNEALNFARSVQKEAEGTDTASNAVMEKAHHAHGVVRHMLGAVNHFHSLGDVASNISDALFAAQSSLNVGPEPFNILRTKEAHLLLLGTLEQVRAGEITLQPENVTLAHMCELGQWIQGEGQEKFGTSDLFMRLDATHQQVHTAAREIVQWVNEGKTEAVDDAMRYFYQARDALFSQLDRLYLGQTVEMEVTKSVLHWREELSVGVRLLDLDHKRLIELVNQLNSAMVGKMDRSICQKVVKELINYVRDHFHREERFMEENGFQELEHHKQMHGQFLEDLRKLVAKANKEGVAISSEMVEFVKNWFPNHVMSADMRYKALFASKKVT
ncbi:MAG: bacteriohemerythrin [Magnetococcales bacterium]|nr:bacteriohemerythrin [Magnetococcales bacterium]